MASTAAGRTGASRVGGNSYVPTFNIWRSIVKTLSIRNSGASHLGISPRPWRNGAKMAGWLLLGSLPNVLLMRYAMQEEAAAYFGNGDPRWAKSGHLNVADLKARVLPWETGLFVDTDPWKYFVPAYNEIHEEPWEQLSRTDGVLTEETSWRAFGTAAQRMQGNHGHTMQKLNIWFLFSQQEEEKSFAKFYAKMLYRSACSWANDVYYSYWGVYWNVPLEERYESLGQRNGRRITKRWYIRDGLFATSGLTYPEMCTVFGTMSGW